MSKATNKFAPKVRARAARMLPRSRWPRISGFLHGNIGYTDVLLTGPNLALERWHKQ